MLARALDRWLAFVSAFVAVSAGCRCGDPEDAVVATLVDGSGDITKGSASDVWTPAPEGTQFRVGDAVKTGVGAVGGLRFGGGHLHMGASSTVWFTGSPTDRLTGIDIETGEAQLEAGAGDVRFRVGIGIAVGNVLLLPMMAALGNSEPIKEMLPSMLGASSIMLLVGLIACGVPARRALRIEANEAIRYSG